MPLVRFHPVRFGYGPVGKALHIARALRATVGEAITLELVGAPELTSTAEQGLFDKVGIAPSQRTAGLVVSVMDRRAVQHARERGEP
ncbi:MAG TPA: hypothetical protein VGW38_06665, partial [Chloroflexota bacterium]|nr:hypothetical protein [Chloroflexota bacterium]